MRGLLIKEWRMRRILIECTAMVLCLVALVYENISGNDLSRTVFIFLLCSSSSTDLLYPKNNQSEKYFATFPYNRTQLIAAKYLCHVFPVNVLPLMLIVFLPFLDISLATIGMTSVILYVPTSLILPVYYFSTPKDRGRNLAIILIICYSCMSFFIGIYEVVLKSLFIFNEGLPVLFVLLFVLYIGSYFLSVYFYKKRDI